MAARLRSVRHSVPQSIAKEIKDVRLQSVVTGIDYRQCGTAGSDSRKVIVRTAQEEVEADAVVCTVPLGVLKKGYAADRVIDCPALPARRTTRDTVGCAVFGRVGVWCLRLPPALHTPYTVGGCYRA